MAIKFISRDSIGSYYNSVGRLTLAGVNEARMNYNPSNLNAAPSLLIEEARTNLLTYSENFDNAAWAKVGTASVTANNVTAPDGTLTADTLNFPAMADRINPFGGTAVTSNTTYTASIWLSGTGAIELSLANGNGTYAITTNEITLTPVLTRYQVTHTTSATTTISYFIVGRYNGTGTATSAVAWGAQLEAGAFSTSYIPSADSFTSRASSGSFIGSNGLIQSATTNVARYNYNPLNLALAPKLLLEPAATNLLTYSEQFDNAAWVKYGTCTVTANATTAPDGTVTADSVVLQNSSGIYQNQTSVITGNITCSIWLKAATNGTTVRLLSNTNLSDFTYITCNLTTDWQRFSITRSLSAGTTLANLQLDTISTAGAVIYAWGAQLETGTTATSYIQTVASQVTRAADVSSSAPRTRAKDITYGMADYSMPVASKITIDSEKTVVFTDITAQFGDGYEQVAPKGINNTRENWSIQWGGLSTSEKDTIITTLNAIGSWGILLWTPCGDSTEKKYRMSKEGYSVRREGSNNIFTVSCSLRQVFDIT